MEMSTLKEAVTPFKEVCFQLVSTNILPYENVPLFFPPLPNLLYLIKIKGKQRKTIHKILWIDVFDLFKSPSMSWEYLKQPQCSSPIRLL